MLYHKKYNLKYLIIFSRIVTMFFHKFLVIKETINIRENLYNDKKDIYFLKTATMRKSHNIDWLLNSRNLSRKLDHISNVISREPQLVRVTWLINDSSIFTGMTFRYASMLCCAAASGAVIAVLIHLIGRLLALHS